jgi:hypothetical protein
MLARIAHCGSEAAVRKAAGNAIRCCSVNLSRINPGCSSESHWSRGRLRTATRQKLAAARMHVFTNVDALKAVESKSSCGRSAMNRNAVRRARKHIELWDFR